MATDHDRRLSARTKAGGWYVDGQAMNGWGGEAASGALGWSLLGDVAASALKGAPIVLSDNCLSTALSTMDYNIAL